MIVDAAAPPHVAVPARRRGWALPGGGLLLLLPGAGYIALAMIAPLVQLAFGSIGLAGPGSSSRLSLDAFHTVLADPMMRDAFLFSLRIAFLTTLLSVALAAALAMVCCSNFPAAAS
jgi:ABC-type spermidine/putrescine transport system permease subunit II